MTMWVPNVTTMTNSILRPSPKKLANMRMPAIAVHMGVSALQLRLRPLKPIA